MNDFQAIDVKYLRPSRTIETILLENETYRKVLYVYNYEGWHFQVFDTILDIINFLMRNLNHKFNLIMKRNLMSI